MMLFCAVVDPIIEKMSQKYKSVNFADDMMIAHSPEISSKLVIAEAKEALLTVGLLTADHKCKSTEDENGTRSIEFMGQTFTKDGPRSLAPKITQKINYCMDIIKDAPISI